MKKTFLLLASAGLFIWGCAAVSAQENDLPAPRRNFRSFQPGRLSAENAKKWAQIQSTLKKKYPEKFAKIETLAKTNLPKAMQEMTDLARTAKLEIPRNGRQGNFRHRNGFRPGMNMSGRRPMPGMMGGYNAFTSGNSRNAAEEQIKAKYPAEYAAIVKLREEAENRMQALAKKGNITLPDTPETLRKKFQLVREKYKAEFEEIQKLRRTDRRAAMERTMEIYKREGLTFPRMGMGFGPGRNQGSSMQGENTPPPPPRRGNPMMERLKLLRKTYPEEMQKLDSLRRSDPAAYRQGLRALSKKFDQEKAKAK